VEGALGRQAACEMIKSSLEALCGGPKTATVNILDWPTYLSMMGFHGPMALYAIGWGPDYADPDDYAVPFLDSDYDMYPLFNGYRNDAINALLRSAASELDSAMRADLYGRMSLEVYHDCSYIWRSQPNNFHIERSWISGYYYNPMYSGLYFPALSKSTNNTPPVAHFVVTPPSGDVTTRFMFDAPGSSDLEDSSTILEVRWDFDGDGTWDTNWTTVKTKTNTFGVAGTYTGMLEVRDSGGLTNTTTVDVLVTEPLPEFGTTVVPVLALAAVVLIAKRNSRRKK